MKAGKGGLEALRQRQDSQWREPAQICSQWDEADATDPRLLEYESHGKFWAVLQELDVTILLTREYEHLVMALRSAKGRPQVSFMRMPHPSGMAVDLKRGRVHLASTRNPNQVYDLEPVEGLMPRLDSGASLQGRPLVPARSRFLPGCLYLHDLAMVGGELHANAVGQNAVVRLPEGGGYRRVWWPRSIEGRGGPLFGRNHLQLNSIAAGKDIRDSFFSASAEGISASRPGQKRFPVDGKGVVFSGLSREPLIRGLTRPHSARLHGGKVWVDNSGYGELGYGDKGAFVPWIKLPGWTRGLCFTKGIALVGTSRVLPRFHRYAPGLDPAKSLCGLHLVELKSGRLLGSLIWPHGNQIFAIEAVPQSFSTGFPFPSSPSARSRSALKGLFYAFQGRHSR